MNQSSDPREVIERKRLEDNVELQLKRWTSDVIRPGRVGYQLALVRFGGELTTQFPIDWENYTERQVRDMYNAINSTDDFERIRNN